MRRMFAAALVFAFALAGCRGANPRVVQAAVVATALGLGASAVSRATGGCYSQCPTGTACNEKSGFCEVLPCRDLCDEDEKCDEVTDSCVKKEDPAFTIVRDEE